MNERKSFALIASGKVFLGSLVGRQSFGGVEVLRQLRFSTDKMRGQTTALTHLKENKELKERSSKFDATKTRREA